MFRDLCFPCFKCRSQGRHNFIQISDNSIICHIKNRCVFIFVYCNYSVGTGNSCQMLDCPGNAHCKIEFGSHRLTRLSYLVCMRHPACVYHRSAAPKGCPQLCRQLLQQPEILCGTHAPAAGYDNLSFLQIDSFSLTRSTRVVRISSGAT